MKKESKARVAAVKKYCATHSEKVKEFICIMLAIIVALICADALVNIQSNDDMVACKEELASYLASPSRYAINTDKYTLEISKKGTELSINNSLAACTAVFDNSTNSYNYTSSQHLFLSCLFMIILTVAFSFIFYFIFYGIIAIVIDVSELIKEQYKAIQHEYKLNKAEAELNLTQEESAEYELSIQQKEAYDRAYKQGFDSGYTDGRSKGFKQGQYDAYEEGYTKGYVDGQDEVSDAIATFMNDDECIADECDDEDLLID